MQTKGGVVINKNIILLIVLIVVLPAGIFGCVRDKQPTLSEEDTLARIDDNSKDQGTPPQDAEVFPDTELGKKLKQHIQIIALPSENGVDADKNYSKSLAELRKTPAEAVTCSTTLIKKLKNAIISIAGPL